MQSVGLMMVSAISKAGLADVTGDKKVGPVGPIFFRLEKLGSKLGYRFAVIYSPGELILR